MISRPKVGRNPRIGLKEGYDPKRVWFCQYPVNDEVHTGWFPSWRDAMRFAGFCAAQSKPKLRPVS